jgi:histone H3/H4
MSEKRERKTIKKEDISKARVKVRVEVGLQLDSLTCDTHIS